MFHGSFDQRRRESTVVRSVAVALVVVCAMNVVSLLAREQNEQSPAQRQIVFFSAQIASDDAPVFASPSADAYQTGSLVKGENVEIYFRDARGNCAIRPPKGSFSWVNGKFVHQLSETEGIVAATTRKAIPARVGAQSPEDSVVVQVGLKGGQKIKILGKTTLEDGSVWFQIAPPPGEFRWIRESNLAPSPALAQLPERLTSQDEYLEQLGSSRQKQTASSEKIEKKDATSSVALDCPASEQPIRTLATSDRKTFNEKIARLNADVLRAFRGKTPSDAELSSLQSRAEELFDSAPSDEDRFFIQSIFDEITKAQINRLQTAANSGAERYEQHSDQAARWNLVPAQPMIQTANGNEGYVAPFFNQSGQFVDVPVFVDERRVEESRSKSRLGFAFSRENNPFLKSPKQSGAASKPKTARMESSLAKLLESNEPVETVIVPPQNYIFPKSADRSSSYNLGKPIPSSFGNKIVQPQAAEPRVVARQDSPPTSVPVLRGKENSPETLNPSQSDEAIAAFGKRSTRDSFAPLDAAASEEAKLNEENKIRQASAFAPVASQSFKNIDSIGILVELSQTSDGGPRYALLNDNEGDFNIVAYLAPGRNVSFDKFIGQRVVVKGETGTVTVAGKKIKHVVVSSLFLQK